MCAIFSLMRTGSTTLIKGSLALTSVLFIVLSCNVFILNKEYKVKNVLIEYGELVKDAYLIEGLSHAYSFYTKAIPLFSCYNTGLSIDANQQLAEEKKAVYERHDENNLFVTYKKVHSSTDERCQIGDEMELNGQSFQVMRKHEISYYSIFLLKYVP